MPLSGDGGTYVALSVQVVPVTAAGLTVASPRMKRLGRAVLVAASSETMAMNERILGIKVMLRVVELRVRYIIFEVNDRNQFWKMIDWQSNECSGLRNDLKTSGDMRGI